VNAGLKRCVEVHDTASGEKHNAFKVLEKSEKDLFSR
jgi:hypothetical protein